MDMSPFQRQDAFAVCHERALGAHNETFSALHLIEHTHNYSDEDKMNTGHFPKMKIQPSVRAGLISEKSRFSHGSLDFSLQISMAFLWALISDGCHFRISRWGSLLLSVCQRQSFGKSHSWCPTSTVCHLYMRECDEEWSSHRRPYCEVADGKQLVPCPSTFLLIISTTPFSPAAPQTRPREAGSPTLRHLWVSPDGGKGSGNESKQPILSEHIRAAVHHAADLQGVRMCACVTPECLCVQVCAY